MQTRNKAGEMKMRGTNWKLFSSEEISPEERLIIVAGVIRTREFWESLRSFL